VVKKIQANFVSMLQVIFSSCDPLIFKRINLLIPFELSLSVAAITWLKINFKFIFFMNCALIVAT
jgi:hypothetical protein